MKNSTLTNISREKQKRNYASATVVANDEVTLDDILLLWENRNAEEIKKQTNKK